MWRHKSSPAFIPGEARRKLPPGLMCRRLGRSWVTGKLAGAEHGQGTRRGALASNRSLGTLEQRHKATITMFKENKDSGFESHVENVL